MKPGTVAVSWGPWGGFYSVWNDRGAMTRRLCLGWVAITWVALEIDDLMEAYAAVGESDGEEQLLTEAADIQTGGRRN